MKSTDSRARVAPTVVVIAHLERYAWDAGREGELNADAPVTQLLVPLHTLSTT